MIELDMASCDDETGGTGPGGGSPPTDGTSEGDCEDYVNTVAELFEYEKMRLCFIELGLDFEDIYAQLYASYYNNDVGVCGKSSDPSPDIATISDLTYIDWEEYVAIGTSVTPSIFQWSVTGTPADLVLDDNTLVSVDKATRRRYKIKDDIPIMLIEESKQVSMEEWTAIMKKHGKVV